MISKPATTRPGAAVAVADEAGCEPEAGPTDEPPPGAGRASDSWAVWASSAQIGQIVRRSVGIGSAWGCSQVWPSGQVRRTVVMDGFPGGMPRHRRQWRHLYCTTVTHPGQEYNTGLAVGTGTVGWHRQECLCCFPAQAFLPVPPEVAKRSSLLHGVG